jgi:hypothetical protein
MNPGRRLVPPWLLALAVGLLVSVVGLPAGAVQTPVGSKNFTPPSYVPNYFSNESGAFTGARGARQAPPIYAAPRAYPRSAYRHTAATHRSGHYRRHTVSRRSYHYRARGRAVAHRHFVHVAARGGRPTALHNRPANGHHRVVRPHARSTAGTKRIARAGR